MSANFQFLDAHVHHWDPRNTPRQVSPLVRMLGFSPRLLDRVAPMVFPKDVQAFYGTPEFILRPYLTQDYVADLADVAEVVGLVHVEAGWVVKEPTGPVDETRWVDGLAPVGNVGMLGIVANADLTLGERVEDVLVAHLEASTRVRGIRDLLAWHPSREIMNTTDDPERSRQADFRRGFEMFSKYGLNFETSIFSTQLTEMVELARTFPEQPILVCHMATPVAVGGPIGEVGRTADERARIRGEWAEGIARLAECANVWMKLSGLLMPICGFGFERRSARPSVDELVATVGPFIDHVIDAFGPERCMFGSNFPVDKPSAPLPTLLQAYRLIVEGLPDEAQNRLFVGTAQEFYRLAPDHQAGS